MRRLSAPRGHLDRVKTLKRVNPKCLSNLLKLIPVPKPIELCFYTQGVS